MANGAVQARQDSDSLDMRLMTRAATDAKDAVRCTGPQRSSTQLGPGRRLMLKLCRYRDLRRARAETAKAAHGGDEGERLDQMESGVVVRPAKGTTFRSLLQFYLECTSAHGLPRAARSNSFVRRILWAGTFAFFVAYFIYQFVALLTMFYNFPVGVKIVIEQKRVIEFPAVTVCNLNIMKVSRLTEDPKYQNLGRIDRRIRKQVHHLLGALHLEENMGSEDPRPLLVISPYDNTEEDDYEPVAGHGEDYMANRRFLRYERTQQERIDRRTADLQNRSLVQDSQSNATAGLLASAVEGGTNSTGGNESGVESLLRNRKHVEFGQVENEMAIDLKDFRYHENNFATVSNDYEFDKLMAHSLTSDYSDMFDLLKPTSEDLEKYGHKAKDFIIQCSMDSKSCSYRRDFQRRESPYYGNCYTFNHGSGSGGSPVILSSKYGSRYGLRLTLNIEHDEYIGLFSQKAGVRVAIHPYNIPPFPEDFGLNASPGSETEIGVTMEYVRRLPNPYPTNCTDRKMYHSSLSWDSEGLYTVMACIKSCLQRKIEGYCGCVDSEVTSAESMVARCLSTNTTQEKCRQRVRYLFETNHQGCDCPPPCQEVTYKTTISSTVWPSQPYANLLASALMDEKTFFRKSDIFKRLCLYHESYAKDLLLFIVHHLIAHSFCFCLCGCLSVYLSVCPSVCLSVCMSACLCHPKVMPIIT